MTVPDRDPTSCLSLQLSVAMSRQKSSAKTLIITDGEFGQTRDPDEELRDEAQSSNRECTEAEGARASPFVRVLFRSGCFSHF